ncbi:MAG: ion transporter [Lentisphaeria bacterium]|nr:ion transporter [Lentisphaeria bacterium]
MKKYIFEIIQPGAEGQIASRIFDAVIMSLIFLSVVSVFAMTFSLSDGVAGFLMRVEDGSLIVFSAEYLLRIWTADLLYPDCGPVKSRLKYMISGMAVIDLISILPCFLPMIFPANLVSVRAFRLVRLLRIFKMNRYSDALLSIREVFRRKLHEILASIFVVFILLVIASLLIYYAEHDAQPEQFANAFSGLWWAVATLTTVGYGDIYPVTVMGRTIGAMIAILGIGMVAVPTGILSAGFVEFLEKKSRNSAEDGNEPPRYCPHCGKKL